MSDEFREGLNEMVNESFWAAEKARLIAALCALPSDDDRLDVLREFCRACGSVDAGCQCWNDD